MKTYGIIEVILFVKDMGKMVPFYRDVLDLPMTNPSTRDFTKESWITFETGNCQLALHSGGQGNIGADAPKVVFQVGDIRSARFQLLEAGVSVSEIRSLAQGILVCDGKDPEGNPFSIEQREI